MLDGKPVKYEVEKGARPSKKEKSTANGLGEHGFKCIFRATRSDEGKRTSDIFLLVRNQDGELEKVPYEFKAPSGSGKQTIYHQFEDAADQAENIVLDAAFLGGRWVNKNALENEVRHKMQWTYKSEKEEGWKFKEAMILNKDGTLTIIREGLNPPV